MNRLSTTRWFGVGILAGIPISFALWLLLELSRPDRTPWGNLLNDYLVGAGNFVGRIAAAIVAILFFLLAVGLRRRVRPSASLTVSCLILGLVAASLGLTAIFPADSSPGGGLAGAIHYLSETRYYVLLCALVITLPIALWQDENWQLFAKVTLLAGLAVLMSSIAFALSPLALRGLVQREIALILLAWLFMAGWRLGHEHKLHC